MQGQRRFATRLNSFASKPSAYWSDGHGKPTALQMAERASKAKGLTDVDLNYPDHLGTNPRATGQAIRDLGLAVNGLAMRYYSNPRSRSAPSPTPILPCGGRRSTSPSGASTPPARPAPH